MHPTTWSDDHDRLMAYAEPPVTEPSGDELERVWARVAGTLDGGDRTRRRRRRLRAGIAAGVGAVVLGTSGLAAADHFTAHTGKGPVDAEDLRLGGPGERLHDAAPDFGAVIAEVTADIPFPTRAAREFALQDQVRDAAHDGTDSSVSTGAVRAWVADAALCSWADQWAAATRDGDEAARAEAIEVIRAAPTWPAVVAIDPHPYHRMEKTQMLDRSGRSTTQLLADDSQFFYLAALGEAVEGRDPTPVARVLAKNNGYCRPGNVPDLPAADPMFGVR